MRNVLIPLLTGWDSEKCMNKEGTLLSFVGDDILSL